MTWLLLPLVFVAGIAVVFGAIRLTWPCGSPAWFHRAVLAFAGCTIAVGALRTDQPSWSVAFSVVAATWLFMRGIRPRGESVDADVCEQRPRDTPDPHAGA